MMSGSMDLSNPYVVAGVEGRLRPYYKLCYDDATKFAEKARSSRGRARYRYGLRASEAFYATMRGVGWLQQFYRDVDAATAPFRVVKLNDEDWPVTESGHYICSPDRPRPASVRNANNWLHVGAVQEGTTRDALASWAMLVCPNCRALWRREL